MSVKQTLILPAFLALASAAFGADEVRIGDPRLDPSFIRPYQSRFALTGIDADGKTHPQGEWTDRVSFVDQSGRRLLRREVARYTAAGVRDLWRVHLVDAATLAPLLTDQRGETDAITHLDFAGSSVTATVLQSPETAVVQVPFELPESPFDLSIWATLLMSVPFEAGLTLKLPVLGDGGQLVWETVSVEGEETVELPAGEPVPSWRVSTHVRPWTAWLSKSKTPYIIKTLQRFPDGSSWVSLLVEAKAGDPPQD